MGFGKRHDRGRIAINPDRFDKLITTLRTAVDNDGVLDKESTSYKMMLNTDHSTISLQLLLDK